VSAFYYPWFDTMVTDGSYEHWVQEDGAAPVFIERPGEVDDVLNAGTIPYVLFVTFPRVPQGDSARTDESDPGTCPGV
jgi:hypothetical protein